MVIVPIIITVVYVLMAIIGFAIVFGWRPKISPRTMNGLIENILVNLTILAGLVLMYGSFTGWAIVYAIMSVVSLTVYYFKIGKEFTVSQLQGLFIVISSWAWIWIVWHVYGQVK